ncbi:MAG: cardiolipin synthase [Pseudomonadota bacterium]|nr:cardiolipin synthase [Pseudomonadota bacterium]
MPDFITDLWEVFVSIPHIGLYLILGWIAYMLWVGAWIILQKREPAATLSWLMGLAALPYVGFLIYHFFGPQRIKRHRLRRSRTRDSLPTLAKATRDLEAMELARLGHATTGLPPSTASDVRLLVDGSGKYPVLLADVAQAKHHIHLEYYIYHPDQIGTALRDALVERARAGVKVRVLLDAVGSGKASRAFMQPLTDAGGELAWFHPMRLGRIWRRPWLNMRCHRKIVVIDNRVAFTGGMNITDEQDDRVRSDAYRDLHLRIEGDAVRSLQAVFIEDWAYANDSKPLEIDIACTAPGPIPAQVLTSGPDSSWEAIHRLHVGAIHGAEKRVWLLTPYFVPGEAAMMALTSAALGGVDVRLLVPKMSDSKFVTYAARSYYEPLLDAGVKVFEYGPRLMHSKALLVDDDLALIGSANFDHRSFRLNFEVSVLFRDAGIAAQLATLAKEEFATATRVPHERDRRRPLFRVRLPEALARLFSPLL